MRRDARQCRGQAAQARRPGAAPALREQRRRVVATDFWDIIIADVKQPEHKHLEGLTLGDMRATKLGKHYVDAMLDLAVADRLRTEFFAPAPHHPARPAEKSPTIRTRFRACPTAARTPSSLTGGRLSDRVPGRLRARHPMSLEEAHWKLSALPAYCGGFRRPRHAARGLRGRHRDLRLRPPEMLPQESRTTFRPANGAGCNAPTVIATSWSTAK